MYPLTSTFLGLISPLGHYPYLFLIDKYGLLYPPLTHTVKYPDMESGLFHNQCIKLILALSEAEGTG